MVISALLLFLAGCSHASSTYQFSNETADIVSIEMLHNQNPYGEGTDINNIHLIRELEEDEIVPFMTEIYALETDRYNPPLWGYGEYIAKVTYTNGDIEMLGSLNIVYIASGADSNGVSPYFFTGDGFTEVFSEYVDISNLS